MKQSHKTLLLWVVLIVMFLAIWQFLSPQQARTPVAFSEFLNEVHAGHVDTIKIKDRDYTYTVKVTGPDGVKGSNTARETIGPVADEKLLDDLRPEDKTQPAPKVTFEKEDASPFWSSTLAEYPTAHRTRTVTEAANSCKYRVERNQSPVRWFGQRPGKHHHT